NVALPTISRKLSASTQDLQWVVDAYTLVFAALLLVGGNLGDRIGRYRALPGYGPSGRAGAVGAVGQRRPRVSWSLWGGLRLVPWQGGAWVCAGADQFRGPGRGGGRGRGPAEGAPAGDGDRSGRVGEDKAGRGGGGPGGGLVRRRGVAGRVGGGPGPGAGAGGGSGGAGGRGAAGGAGC